jgi:hypothetical protein
VVTGLANSLNGDVTGNHGGGDMWAVKLSEHENILWKKAIGGAKFDVGHLIGESPNGGYIVSGHIWSNNFDVPQGVKGRSDY